MLAKVFAAANTGYDSQLVEVECDLAKSLPGMVIVGLANKSVDEAKERLRGALTNSGLITPRKRIILNLAPADLPKAGTAYDVALAVAILAASGQIPVQGLDKRLFVGELALDGKLRGVSGTLSYAQLAQMAGLKEIFVPSANAREAAMVRGITVVPTANLHRLHAHLSGKTTIKAQPPTRIRRTGTQAEVTLGSIYGQESAKRALEIAAAGNHNLLLSGPPGAGKTMLAKALLSILPPPSFEEILEITKLHSLAGAPRSKIITNRPFRSPHHTASDVALIGGGAQPRPGEISLAHNGVLFLDELPEFRRNVLEVLRQPLESHVATISRARRSVTYPARFMLVATQNPCPCGYWGDLVRDCSCSPAQIASYTKKVSGPLLDRIDLVVNMQRVEHQKLLRPTADSRATSSTAKRVAAARNLQSHRYGQAKANGDMDNDDIRAYCVLKGKTRTMAESALKQLDLSARGYMKMLKVARTIADLDKSDTIESRHLAEALQYRASHAAAI